MYLLHMKTKINDFLLHQTSLKESSLKTYKQKLLTFAHFVGSKAEFTKHDILLFFKSKKFNMLKPSTQNLYKNILRQFLKFLKMEYEFIKLQRHDPELIKKEDLPTKQEITKLLENMHRAMDKCVVMVFLEGLRLGEACNVKLADVVNRKTHMIIYVQISKSKKRAVPIISSVPFIINWLNQHPDKNNPDAYLFCHKHNGKIIPYSSRGLQKIISRNNNVSDKNIHPHLFRHTAATIDYGKLTEKEMMLKYGWKTRGMIDRYAHVVDTDLEDKLLQLHGIIPEEKKEVDIKIIENITCLQCSFLNPGTNKFCSECGSVLDIKTVLRAEEIIEIGKKTLNKEDLFELFMEWLKKE